VTQRSGNQPASKRCRTAVVAALLIVACQVSAAAALDREGNEAIALGTNIRFTRIGLEEGLAQSSVPAVIQDRQGYMWMATQDGLHRFDGYSFRIFRNDPADPSSISNSSISALFEDRDGMLWVGTSGGGANLFDPAEGRFTRFIKGEALDTLSGDEVASFMQDRAGAVWVATLSGINRIERPSGKVTRFAVAEPAAETERDGWALHALEGADGRLWVGTDRGLNRLDPATGKVEAFPLKTAHINVDTSSVSALRFDAAGRLWVATNHGLVVLDAALKVEKEFYPVERGGTLPERRVADVLFNRGGETWLALYRGGLVQIDYASGRLTAFRHDPADRTSLSTDNIVSLFEDRGGVLWVGTDSAGLNRFNPATRSFTHYRHQPNNPRSLVDAVVWAVLPARDGSLWVGTENGLNRIDRARGEYRRFQPAEGRTGTLNGTWVSSLLQDARGSIWVGTNKGVQRLRPDGATFEDFHLRTEGTGDDQVLNDITALHEGDGDRIWVGSYQGLVALSSQSGAQRRYRHDPKDPRSLPSDTVISLARTADGTLWIGTDKGVAWQAPGGEGFDRLGFGGDPKLTLTSPYVQSINEDDQGAVWFGTSAGLERFDRKSGAVERFGAAQGLPNETVYAIERTADGAFWLSTNRGLVRFDPRTRALRTWLVEDGLQSNEFNGGSSAIAANGELFFGGINGLNAFFPENLSPHNEAPTAGITQVEVVDRELELTGELGRSRRLTLLHTEPAITIQFAVFDYAAPQNNSFRFKLEGFDRDWRDARGRHTVTYTNLDAGEYVFSVQGANTHGILSNEPATLTIVVLPPPWLSWWAYLGYGLALALTLFGVARAHHSKLKRDHELAAEQAKRRWSETLHQLSQSLASSLDAHQIAELLMDSLRRMVNFRAASLFVEKGVEIQLVGTRGLAEEQVRLMRTLPEVRARLFAECRHRRDPTALSAEDVKDTPLASDGGAPMHVLAIPTFSRAEEFSLLLIGRSETPFSPQEQEIAAAVARQALVALDNARLFSELQNLATTDNLTKVNNRRYFFELAELEFARSRRYGRNLAVILLDADGFTNINESYGHEVGDRVLRLIASTCRANLRHFDIIGRYGGEDFVVMLPETALNVAADVADRLRKAVDSMVIETHSGELKVSVSLGVAVSSPEVPDLATLINRADMALYEAKRSGRNRVVVSEQS